MAKLEKTRLILFLPEQDALHETREEVLARYPGLRVLHWGEFGDATPEARDEALATALRAAKQSGWILIDPPADIAQLENIDRVARETLGRKGLPHAVFYSPPRSKGKEGDPFAGYRESFRALFQHYRKDRRSVVFEKPKPRALRKAVRLASKAGSPIRWALLTPMVASALGLVLLIFLFRDSLLRRASIALGQMAFGAKVEINLLDTTLDPALDLANVAIADRDDPERNLFEFESLRSDLNLGALFGGQVLVHEASLVGLRFGGPRELSGALPGLEVVRGEGGKAGKGSKGDKPPELKQDSANRFEELIERLRAKLEPPAPEDLETVRLAHELEAEAKQRLERLRQRVEGGETRQRIDGARARLSGLLENPVPASVAAFRERLASFGSLSLPDLETVTGALTLATELDFGPEAKSIAKAKKRWQKVAGGLSKAQETIDEASKFKKLDLFNAAKLPGLIRDVQAAIETLSGAGDELGAARELVLGAQNALEQKRADGRAALERARAGIEAARAAAAQSAEASVEAWDGLQQDLVQVRQEAAAARAELEGALSELAALVDAVEADWKALGAEVAGSLAFLRAGAAGLEAASERDVLALKARYSFSSWKAEELLAPLVGESTFGWLERGWSMRARLAPFLGGDGAEGAGPPSDEPTCIELPGGGRRYFFPLPPEPPGEPTLEPAEPPAPGLWIERALFSGELELGGGTLALAGQATDISSSPARLGKPIVASFEAEQGARRMRGELSYTTQGELVLDASGSGFAVAPRDFGSPYAPRLEAGGTLAWEMRARFGEDGLSASIHLELEQLALGFDGVGVDARLAEPFRELYGGLESVEATIELAANANGIQQLSVSSNLGPAVQSVFEDALGAQLQDALNSSLAQLESKIAAPRAAALSAVEAFGGDSQALLDLFGGDLSELKGSLGTRRASADELLADQLDLPQPGGAPPAAGADQEARLAELEESIQAQDEQLVAGDGGPDGDAEEVLGGISSTEDAKDKARERLDKELKRLEKLRP